jgi:hypothetical protein
LNVGHFQLERDSGATVAPVNSCEPDVRAFLMDPSIITINLTSDDVDENRRCTFWAPYFKNSTGHQFTVWLRGTGTGTQIAWYLHHVQPIAFRGVVSEVIGALLMYAGYDAARIDQDSFDEAYDAELMVGADNSNRPYVWVIPQQGESVMATIKRVMLHWDHILTFNNAGKLALVPVESVDTPYVFLSEHSNILKLKQQVDKSLIYNYSLAMHGGGYMRHAEYVGISQPSPIAHCTYEPHLKSDYQQAMIDEYKDTASVNQFGERQFGSRVKQTLTEGTAEETEMTYGRGVGFGFSGIQRRERIYTTRTIDTLSEGEPITVAHFPLCHRKTIKDLIMARFLSNETQIRNIGEVEQDLLGFDHDIGQLILDTDTGLTYRCVKQTMDFNKFTVKSGLIQEHATEYSTAETVIWEFINLEDAPVGGSGSMFHSIGNTYVTLTLTVAPVGHDWHYQIWVSADGGPWFNEGTNWTAEVGPLVHQVVLTGEFDEVRFFIRGADDDGSGGQEIPTHFVKMPTATI